MKIDTKEHHTCISSLLLAILLRHLAAVFLRNKIHAVADGLNNIISIASVFVFLI